MGIKLLLQPINTHESKSVWSFISHVIISILYQMKGQPFAAYDKLSFTKTLDFQSTNKAPSWKDGFQVRLHGIQSACNMYVYRYISNNVCLRFNI